MKVEINTKEKTIKILEECSFGELKNFMKNIDDYIQYKIISDIQNYSSGIITTTGRGFKFYDTGSSDVTNKIPSDVTYTTSN
jgi:hypothetical protein